MTTANAVDGDQPPRHLASPARAVTGRLVAVLHREEGRVRHLAMTRVGPRLAARQPRRVDLDPARWGLSVGPAGTLRRGAVDLEQLAHSVGTPFHLVDGGALDGNVARASRGGSGDDRVDLFYSYKTNPVPGVLQRLHRQGVGAEVISPYELWLALELGVDPQRIIYNGPAKSDDSLRQAITAGVLVINANSAAEMDRISRLAAEHGTVASVGIRVSLPGMWGGQFGVDAGSAELEALVRSARADRGLRLRGLHLHRGGGIRHEAEMVHYVTGVVELLARLRRETGWHPEILDIGGSLTCPTTAAIPNRQFRLNRAFAADLLPPDPAIALTLAESSAIACDLVRRYCTDADVPMPRLVQEPGRALTADTQLLVTSVVDVKYDGTVPHAVLDAGMNLAEPVLHEFHQLFSVSAPTAPVETSYRLTGPICTPADVLYNHWRLPRLEPGHVLAIMDTGAYFVPFSTTFSFPRPAIYLQDGDEVTVLRRRETFDDLVSHDQFRSPAAIEALP